MLSAIVLSKNEENNIIKSLGCLSFCDEIIVIDDHSDDKTIELINKSYPKVKIYRRKLDGDFAEQRNFGLKKATGDWILFLDSDEIINNDLACEILKELSIKENPYKGYYFKRSDYFLGKKLKFGETSKVTLLRLARKNAGKWKRKVHEVWDIRGKTKILNNPIIHYPHPTLNKFIADINIRTDLDVSAKFDENKRSNLFKIIIWPSGKFINNYVFKMGFLDSTHAFVMAVLMSFHSFLSWSKLWIYQRRN